MSWPPPTASIIASSRGRPFSTCSKNAGYPLNLCPAPGLSGLCSREKIFRLLSFIARPPLSARESVQEIALCHRQHLGRSASQQFAVGTHLVRLRIDRNVRRRVVVHHAFLVDLACVRHCDQFFLNAELLAEIGAHRRL